MADKIEERNQINRTKLRTKQGFKPEDNDPKWKSNPERLASPRVQKHLASRGQKKAKVMENFKKAIIEGAVKRANKAAKNAHIAKIGAKNTSDPLMKQSPSDMRNKGRAVQAGKKARFESMLLTSYAKRIINELGAGTLQRYKDKATSDRDSAEDRGDVKHADKRAAGVQKAGNKLVKKAQGKNTPTSTFGGKNRSSGAEHFQQGDKKPPMSPEAIRKSGVGGKPGESQSKLKQILIQRRLAQASRNQ